MLLTSIIAAILVSAFSGWLVVSLCIYLLFRPWQPFNFFGFRIQGFFPANYERLIGEIAGIINREFVKIGDIEKLVVDPANLEKLKPAVEAHIDHFLRNKLKDVFPMLAGLIGEKTISQLKDAFLQEMELLFPSLMSDYLHSLQENIDAENFLRKKMLKYPPEKIEMIVYEQAGKQIRKMKLLGVIIGLLTGLIQILITTII